MGDHHKSTEECFDKLCDAIDNTTVTTGSILDEICEVTRDGFVKISETLEEQSDRICGAIADCTESIDMLVNQFKILNSSMLQMTATVKDIAFNTGE